MNSLLTLVPPPLNRNDDDDNSVVTYGTTKVHFDEFLID